MENINQKLNWLRAAVLGGNDGIVSISAVVVGMAGATNDLKIIFYGCRRICVCKFST
ncbi:MAG: Protein of hypothetical function DUF125 transmembrane [Candidatus Nomurabacteria bacterium GW2011_GWC2_35_8]|uniref:Protein of hypothetical function DUF125 transmembrane n=1 Tax=Candidatus Nomurabacteria bacterium GW2011_GWC2_35_8 TaxID=1618752 RepID=A0A0G0D6G7_9BACT|nr:MAG: Protein of hypothetical function DUF125 transmembrane [Candidatus Nomurabacteria bacterium GW2011_GWC2_35_8]